MDYQEYVSYEPILARRCWAAALDYALYFGIVIGYTYFFGERNEEGKFAVTGILHIVALKIIWLIYFPVIESKFGYTLFKGLFDLKVVQEQRNDFPFFVSWKRHFLDPIDFFMFGIVGIILAKVRPDHKRLGDMFAHSRVVLDKEPDIIGLPHESFPLEKEINS